MTAAFGGPFKIVDDTQLPAVERALPADYSEWVRQKLANITLSENGTIRFRRPRPTAAFSPQDITHVNYARIKELVLARGFTPVERGTGGRLTCFDETSLAVTVIAPHNDPHSYMMKRYEILSSALVGALGTLGIDARVGELPREFCPGKFSINAGGQVKLVGVAQRMNRRAYQMGAVITVERSESACAAIADAYRGMDLEFDDQTYGSVKELVPRIAFRDVTLAIETALRQALMDD